MHGMFERCVSLKNLNKLYKWDISKLNNLDSVFNECCSCENLEGISEWNTSNIKSLNRTFMDVVL